MSAIVEAPQEKLYQVIARRDKKTGSPLLGDCKLHTGYGMVELRFGASEEDVPETVARALMNRDDVMVIETSNVGPAPAPLEMPADTAAIKLADMQRQLDAAEAALLVANGGAFQEEGASTLRLQGPNGEVIVVTQEQLAAIAMQHFAAQAHGADSELRREAAAEHLREESLEDPEPITAATATPSEAVLPVLLPEGFKATLDDGTARCLAAKGDGTQCKNASTANKACGLDPHQAQLKDRGAHSAA